MGDSDWRELLHNGKEELEIFDDPPNLDGRAVAGVHLDENNTDSLITIEFSLSGFPQRPPVCWRQKHFNSVELWLEFTPVRDLRIRAGQISNIATSIIGENEGVLFRAVTENFTLSFRSARVGVTRLHAYQATS